MRRSEVLRLGFLETPSLLGHSLYTKQDIPLPLIDGENGSVSGRGGI
jgi:hypothetical protein